MIDGPARAMDPNRRRVAAGVLLGLGLGGFVDGIVLHQVLQWHHMLTDYGSYSTYPNSTIRDLEDNTFWDGLFHLSTWVFVVVGAFLLRSDLDRREPFPWRAFLGLLLVGWGLFNLVEGFVDHHLFTIHHVRDDVADPLWWDLGFLVIGAVLFFAGSWLYRHSASPTAAKQEPPPEPPAR
jgi:uncharacterized membrane protein